MKNVLLRDDNSEWWVVPVEKVSRFHAIDMDGGAFPDWAIPVIGGGPELVIFGDYEIT